MFILFLITILFVLATAKQESGAFFDVGASLKNNGGLTNPHESFSRPLLYNSTYVEKEENVLRVPNKYYEETKSKKKIKKSPKRTVQKIIKKNNKLKTRKLYLFHPTIVPTVASKATFKIGSYINQNVSTTENSIKKRSRKNQRYIRYPMPFQKLQKREGAHTRLRREERDVYILKDFDEMKFLSKEKNQDKVLTHVQKYW